MNISELKNMIQNNKYNKKEIKDIRNIVKEIEKNNLTNLAKLGLNSINKIIDSKEKLIEILNTENNTRLPKN